MTKTSQTLTWICAGSLTLSLHAAALWLIVIPQKLPEKVTIQEQEINLSFLLPPEPAPAPEPTLAPIPAPASEPTPAPTPPPEPEPPEITPPERIEPPKPPPPPAPDPAILKREFEKKQAAEQKARERAAAEARERAAAKKRMDEKRQKAREATAREKARAKAAAAKSAAIAREKARAKAAAAKRAADAKRIVAKPSAISQKRPRYPSIALRAGHQGTTTLRLVIGSNGRVTSATISKSSGHSSLDKAALSVVRSWRFKPARNGAGQAVSYTMLQSVPFKLK